VNILLMSLGGGGGNILRSVKALYQRDLTAEGRVEDEPPPHRVAARFLDTNQYSLLDVPPDERLLIGPETTHFLGARHDPEVARRAFDESREQIAALMRDYSTVILIATGGKGTGTGTLLPAAMLARQMRKLVIPIFVRPSFERHEVEKRRFDQALNVSAQLDAAQIRFIEILNDRGYVDTDPQPQSVVWERMNVPVARALRGLLYVLSDLSQVDPSDLSALFGGHGRLRLGFSELNPHAIHDRADEAIDDAVFECWANPYCNFSDPIGTSLICIQGPWSNITDAKIKSRLAAQATATGATTYNPLYARAAHSPRPWGVTTLFTEYTGDQPPIDVDWTVVAGAAAAAELTIPSIRDLSPVTTLPVRQPKAEEAESFGSFWDLALAINRSDSRALDIARNGASDSVDVTASEIRKLLGTVWFRSVFTCLSPAWRERLIAELVESVVLPNHQIRIGRRDVALGDLGPAEVRTVFDKTSIAEGARADVRLVMAVVDLWGAEGVSRLRFADVERPAEPSQPQRASALAEVLHGFLPE
jgi:cell division GTPase FtsZ